MNDQNNQYGQDQANHPSQNPDQGDTGGQQQQQDGSFGSGSQDAANQSEGGFGNQNRDRSATGGQQQQGGPGGSGNQSQGGFGNQNAGNSSGRGQQQGESFDSGMQGRQADQGSNNFASQIREHMEVIGADGAHVGTVDEVEGDRIKLTKSDSGVGAHSGHHHYLPLSQVSGVDGNQVRLMASGANEYGMEAER